MSTDPKQVEELAEVMLAAVSISASPPSPADLARAVIRAGWVGPEEHKADLADAERTGFCNGIVWTEEQKAERDEVDERLGRMAEQARMDPKQVAADKGWPEMPEELREDLHGKWSEREKLAYWHGRAVSDAWGVNTVDRLKEEHRAEVERYASKSMDATMGMWQEQHSRAEKAEATVARVEALIVRLRKSDHRTWESNVAEDFAAALGEPERDEEGGR